MSVPESVCTMKIVKELEKPDPMFFGDLKWGTWFCTGTSTPTDDPLVWIKRREERYPSADNAWSPIDGSSMRFDSNQHIGQVFDVKVELVKVSR